MTLRLFSSILTDCVHLAVSVSSDFTMIEPTQLMQSIGCCNEFPPTLLHGCSEAHGCETTFEFANSSDVSQSMKHLSHADTPTTISTEPLSKVLYGGSIEPDEWHLQACNECRKRLTGVNADCNKDSWFALLFIMN